MKKTRFLFITLLLMVVFTVAVSAEALVAQFACDNDINWVYATNGYKYMSELPEVDCRVDYEEYTEGEASLSFKASDESFMAPSYNIMWYAMQDPQSWDVNLENGKIVFDFYTDDEMTCFSISQFEISFGDHWDKHEIGWDMNQQFIFPEAGWNEITLDFADAMVIGNVDFNNITYFRIYGLQVTKGSTIKLDNIRVYNTAKDQSEVTTLVYNSNDVPDPVGALPVKQKIETGLNNGENLLDNMTVYSGEWDLTDAKATLKAPYEGNRGDLDANRMLISDVYVSANDVWVLSGDAVLTEGNVDGKGAMGFVFTSDNTVHPLSVESMLLRTDFGGSAGMWTFNADPYFDSWKWFAGYQLGDTLHYDIVCLGDGYLYGFINGGIVHVAKTPGFEGAYLGLHGWAGTGYFENVKLSTDVTPYLAEGVTVDVPVKEEPKVEEPVVEEPVVEEPAVEEPKVEAPVVEAPKTADVIILLAAAVMVSGGTAFVARKRK